MQHNSKNLSNRNCTKWGFTFYSYC